MYRVNNNSREHVKRNAFLLQHYKIYIYTVHGKIFIIPERRSDVARSRRRS